VSDLPGKYSGSVPHWPAARTARQETHQEIVPAGRATSTSLVHIAGVLTNKYPFRRDLFVQKPYKVMIIGRWPPPREMESLGQVLSSWKGRIRDIMRHTCHESQTAWDPKNHNQIPGEG
jgi:hypothetical protein